MPLPPSASSPPGPAYSPQPFGLISYTQYFANLTFINRDFEDSGLTLEQYIGTNESNPRGAEKEGRARFEFEVEYDTKIDKMYKMKDMTTKSYLDLAQRIARKDQTQDTRREPFWDVLPDGRQVNLGDQEPPDIEEFDQNREEKDEEAERGEKYQMSKKDKGKDKKKHKKHRKHRKHHHKNDKDQLWHTFIKRAFVLTKTDEDMDDFDPKSS